MKKYLYGKKPTEVRDAKGVTGIIINVLGKLYFRVYSDDMESFKDYKFCHQDLKVTIAEDAGFYERKEDDVYTLDYAPECFGLIRVT